MLTCDDVAEDVLEAREVRAVRALQDHRHLPHPLVTQLLVDVLEVAQSALPEVYLCNNTKRQGHALLQPLLSSRRLFCKGSCVDDLLIRLSRFNNPIRV